MSVRKAALLAGPSKTTPYRKRVGSRRAMSASTCEFIATICSRWRTHCPRLANDYGNKGDCVTDIEYALQHYGTVNNEIVRHLAEAGGRVYDIIDGGNLYRSRDGFTYLRFFASPEMVNRLIAKYLGDDVTMVRVDDIMNFTRAAFGPPFTPEFCQVLRPMVPRTLSIILCQHWCFSPLALPGTRTYLTRHRSVILRFDKPFRRGRRV